MRRRRAEELVVRALGLLCLGLIVAALGGIVTVVVLRGAQALSWEMITTPPRSGYYLGGGGGIANAIVGSIYLALGGTLLAALLSLPIAFALQDDRVGRRLARGTRLALDVLWGTPSVVYGALGFVVMVLVGMRASLLAGILTLSLVMLPVMARAMEAAVRAVPRELRELATSLGATRFETTLRVVLRQALPGLTTGAILAFGRGIGDAASILFTAGYSDELPRSLSDPVASLPLAVFFQVATPVAEVQRRAYASALVLLVLVLLVNLAARLLTARLARHTVR